MSRTPRPVDVDKATVALVLLITQRVDKACPTREEIMEVTGLQQRAVWDFVDEMRERGLIEVERRYEGIQRNNAFRMRVFCGQWTGWTKRKAARADACA